MQEETTDELAFLRISNLICILMKWRLDQSNSNPTRVALVAQMAKNPRAMQMTWVQPLGWEDPLEKEMVIHSSILPWRIHGERSLEATVPGVAKSRTRLSDFIHHIHT